MSKGSPKKEAKEVKSDVKKQIEDLIKTIDPSKETLIRHLRRAIASL